MSAELESLLDYERRVDCAANDAAMSDHPPVMRCFAVQIRAGKSVRSQFEAMGFDSMSVTAQHADIVPEGCYLVVRCLEAA